MLFAERLAVSAVTNIGVGSLRFAMSNIMMSKTIWKAKSECFVFFHFLRTQFGKLQVCLHSFFIERLETHTHIVDNSHEAKFA